MLLGLFFPGDSPWGVTCSFPWPWCGVLGKGRGNVWPTVLLDSSLLEASGYSPLLYGHTPTQTQSKADPTFLRWLFQGWGQGKGVGSMHRASRAPLAALSPVLVLSPHHPRALPLSSTLMGPGVGEHNCPSIKRS